MPRGMPNRVSTDELEQLIDDAQFFAELVNKLPARNSDEKEQVDRALAGLREIKLALQGYRYLTGKYRGLAD